jgi:hypothetical protein
MPVPTDHLADEIKEVAQRLAGDVKESNLRHTDAIRELGRKIDENHRELTGAVRELGHKVDENYREFSMFRPEVVEKLGAIDSNIGSLRAEVAEKLGAINTNLESFRSRTETSLSFARWGIGLMAPVLITLVGAAITLASYAAKLDSRVEHVEHRLDQAKGPVTSAATKR